MQDRRDVSACRRAAGILLGALLTGVLSAPLQPAGALMPQQPSPEQAYQDARDLTMRQDWEEALYIFRALADGDSPRAADAAFYVGFCLENMSGRSQEAFRAYREVRMAHPDTEMARRALLRMIPLAGTLGDEDPSYRDFLARHLESERAEVRREAALSLARFGDQRALEGLREILREGSADMKLMALERCSNYPDPVTNELIKEVSRAAAPSAADMAVQRQAERLARSMETGREDRARMEEILARDKKLLMETIKRQGEEWTLEELITHGLLAVMPREMFVRYVQGSEAEKQRLYNEFFRRQGDPLPETDRNELEEEFRRRVEYARENFSEPWQGARSRYDVKEWVTPDNDYAPWDARGELYIRYGDPSDIFQVGFNVEEWRYDRLKVDFTVHLYRSNWYLNAIFPGRASQQDYPPGYVQANFINTPRLEYWPGGRQ
ncbi:MAG: HEAT repeat domain-containing protein [bacterium]